MNENTSYNRHVTSANFMERRNTKEVAAELWGLYLFARDDPCPYITFPIPNMAVDSYHFKNWEAA